MERRLTDGMEMVTGERERERKGGRDGRREGEKKALSRRIRDCAILICKSPAVYDHEH